MSAPTQSDMHAQHVEWKSEHACWLEDVATWQAQHERLLADLFRLEAAVREHRASLYDHAASIHEHQRAIKGHEQEIGELQAAGAGDQADPQLATHEQWAQKHAGAKGRHEAIKQHHHKVLVELTRLVRGMAEKIGVRS